MNIACRCERRSHQNAIARSRSSRSLPALLILIVGLVLKGGCCMKKHQSPRGKIFSNMPNDGDPDPPPINLRTVENLYDATRPEILPGEELQELVC